MSMVEKDYEVILSLSNVERKLTNMKYRGAMSLLFSLHVATFYYVFIHEGGLTFWHMPIVLGWLFGLVLPTWYVWDELGFVSGAAKQQILESLEYLATRSPDSPIPAEGFKNLAARGGFTRSYAQSLRREIAKELVSVAMESPLTNRRSTIFS